VKDPPSRPPLPSESDEISTKMFVPVLHDDGRTLQQHIEPTVQAKVDLKVFGLPSLAEHVEGDGTGTGTEVTAMPPHLIPSVAEHAEDEGTNTELGAVAHLVPSLSEHVEGEGTGTELGPMARLIAGAPNDDDAEPREHTKKMAPIPLGLPAGQDPTPSQGPMSANGLTPPHLIGFHGGDLEAEPEVPGLEPTSHVSWMVPTGLAVAFVVFGIFVGRASATPGAIAVPAVSASVAAPPPPPPVPPPPPPEPTASSPPEEPPAAKPPPPAAAPPRPVPRAPIPRAPRPRTGPAPAGTIVRDNPF
jgi:hypothetical protein